MKPANQPRSAARFQEAPCQSQNSIAVPNGASQAAPSFGNVAAKRTAAQAARPASRNDSEENMIRRLSFGFVVVLVTAFIVVACGRQVTPNPPGLGPGGAPPGYIAVFYSVESPFNFSNYQYIVVLNTSGNGVTPSTQT